MQFGWFRFSPLCVCFCVCLCVCVCVIHTVCLRRPALTLLFVLRSAEWTCVCMCVSLRVCVCVCMWAQECVGVFFSWSCSQQCVSYEEASWDSYAFVIYWSEFLLAARLSEQSFTFVLPPCIFLLLPPLSLPLSLSSYWARRTRAEVRKHLHLCANPFHKVLLCAPQSTPRHS